MADLTNRIALWISSRSVFSLLLITTLFSTCLMSFVLILGLQRVADEHPRRYLSRALFNSIAEQILLSKEPYFVEGQRLVTLGAKEAEATEYAGVVAAAKQDRDGVGIVRFHNYYAAASIVGDRVIVLPRFGEPISTFAMLLVGVVIVAAMLVVTLIYYLMRQLTRPFLVLGQGIARIEEGNLHYQIPLNQTFGEFKKFALSFNNMVAELNRVHEARRHMLLALPHEILTPLSRLQVRKEMVESPELRAKIGRDIAVVEEILSLILAAERRQSHEKHVELVEIVPYVREQISAQVDDRYPIQVVNETGAEVAFFDPFAVSVLLKNFVSNAIRYGNGKPIVVRARREPSETGAIRFSVEDSGVGISADNLKYVTEPFWRADESRGRTSGGYGLGLYLCKTIVERMGGRLKIQSTLGSGTSISVVLPNAICETVENIDK